jgi:hypothetical protein
LLGTVPDGVTCFFMTASRAIQEVEVAKVRDGPVQDFTSDGLEDFTHDGVTTGFRQYDFIIGGELAASEFPS